MTIPEVDEKTIHELAEAGVIYGHKKSKTHPKMKPFIGANRNEIEILKPESVLGKADKALEFVAEKVKNNALILFVGTQASAKGCIKEIADEFGYPYVITRWLGGTMTNFKILRERTNYYLELKEKGEKGELDKYTKKEQLEFSKELEKLRSKFEGLVNMKKVPDAIFIVDPHIHETAIREALRAEVPIIAIADTNDDPSKIKYPIIANDRAKASITWVCDKIKDTIRKAKVDAVKPASLDSNESKREEKKEE